MPRGDGTGPMGQGPGSGTGGGRGQRGGFGGGEGRQGRGGGQGSGGNCVCPVCGATSPHTVGKPCSDENCPKCGAAMRRE